MGKNKGGNNGFYHFMLEFKNTQGRRCNSMRDAAEAAGPFWNNMSREQKKPYEDRARQARSDQRKQTAIGEPIDLIDEMERQKQRDEQNDKKNIETMVDEALKSRVIAEQNFYIMHINDFCYCNTNMRYYPAEIALGRFNFRDGIKVADVYTCLVKPGRLPMGYSAIAKQHSAETHQIPFYYGSDDENNTGEVLASVLSYMSDDLEAGFSPPIFVPEDNLDLVKNVLTNICADNDSEYPFQMYSLQYLFYTLRNGISRSENAWPSISVSQLELQKDVYDFCSDIACDFHDNCETPVYCSKSRVIRLAYIICDNCIGDLGINAIPGQHVPSNSISILPSQPSSSFDEMQSTSFYATPAASGTGYTRSESRMSSVTEVSSIVDSESTVYKELETDSQCDEGWQQAKSTRAKSRVSSQAKSVQDQSQASTTSEYIPSRRPVSQSGVSLRAPQRGANRPRMGRGRGIANIKPQE